MPAPPLILPGVYLPDPVERAHPLNVGLGGWWLNVPGRHGGSALLDLLGRAHLTLSGGPTWLSGGGLSFDGTDDQAVGPTVPGLSGSSRATLSGWFFRRASSPESAPAWGTGFQPNLTQTDRFHFTWEFDSRVYCTAEAGSPVYPFHELARGDAWAHLVMVYNGSLTGLARLALYVDGLPVSLTRDGGENPPSALGTMSELTLGVDDNGDVPPSRRYWAGRATDLRIYPQRAPSPAEVAALYQESARGHTRTLRRLTTTSVVLSGATIYRPTVGGGLVLGGEVTTRRTRAHAPSGGLDLGGTAPVQHTRQRTPEGGLTLGGSAPVRHIRRIAPAGGIALGGEVTAGRVYFRSGDGGLTLGGAAPVRHIRRIAPAGGIVLGGEADLKTPARFRPDLSGGLALGGSAPVRHVRRPSPEGGLALGGSAPAAFFPAGETPAGPWDAYDGVAIAPPPPRPAQYAHRPAGGLRLGGSAPVRHVQRARPRLRPVPAPALPVVAYRARPQGGILLGGSAPVRHDTSATDARRRRQREEEWLLIEGVV